MASKSPVDKWLIEEGQKLTMRAADKGDLRLARELMGLVARVRESTKSTRTVKSRKDEADNKKQAATIRKLHELACANGIDRHSRDPNIDGT